MQVDLFACTFLVLALRLPGLAAEARPKPLVLLKSHL
jgi:hypothetical protein